MKEDIRGMVNRYTWWGLMAGGDGAAACVAVLIIEDQLKSLNRIDYVGPWTEQLRTAQLTEAWIGVGCLAFLIGCSANMALDARRMWPR